MATMFLAPLKEMLQKFEPDAKYVNACVWQLLFTVKLQSGTNFFYAC